MQLTARTAPLRCAYCHDRLAESAAIACTCGTTLHEDCLALAGGCGTLGCTRTARRTTQLKKKKTQQPPPRRRRWWVHGVLAAALVCVGVVTVPADSVSVRNDPAELARAEQLREEGMQAYQAWTRARASGDRALETSSNALARSKLGEAIDCVDQVLVNYRDVEGFVLPEYEGYEQILSEIAVHLIDLEKGRP